MKIAVVSGKGGSGKSSVTAAIVSLAKNVGPLVVIDCDVDASNLPLLFEHDVIASEPFVSGHEVSVDSNLCIGCGRCASSCRFHAITMGEDACAHINPFLCDDCGLCIRLCPQNAITLAPDASSTIYTSTFEGGIMVHGDLHPGDDNSGKMIARLREVADSVDLSVCQSVNSVNRSVDSVNSVYSSVDSGQSFDSSESVDNPVENSFDSSESVDNPVNNSFDSSESVDNSVYNSFDSSESVSQLGDHIVEILDGPPGIGCPVLSTVTGMDRIVFVAEPTLSGISDLKRIHEVCSSFCHDFVAVINKCDVNEDNRAALQTWFEEHNIPVVAQLPMDRRVVEAQLVCKSIVDFAPDSPVSQALQEAIPIILG